jgi:formate dehydrogenase subunit beta
MQVSYILEVQNGDSLQSMRSFLSGWWQQFQPEALLAPIEDAEGSTISSRIIDDPADLARVNPFAPLMTSNAAGLANQLHQEYPGRRVGAILRPCELRTYTELRKRNGTPEAQHLTDPEDAWDGHMVIFGVDCMGTYSQKDYRNELDRRCMAELTEETLRNASAGGFRMQKLRRACQVCDWPAPWGADVVIGTIGVETDRYLLMLARDEICDHCLSLGMLASHPAIEYQVSHRESIVGAVADARAGVRKHLLTNTGGSIRFDDLGSLLGWFAACSLCGECLEACPSYFGELDSLIGSRQPPAENHISAAALKNLVLTSRWLASCSGCGMCEEKCQRQVPLTLFISALSHRIREETDYIAGNPNQPPPWAGD